MQPNISTDVIAGLLPEFRRCETYTDRLAFWGKHQLTEQLYYDAAELYRSGPYLPRINPRLISVKTERTFYPPNFLNAINKCRTWQEVKQLPILTLAPFNADEAWQFIDWALQVRPGMNSDIIPFETLKSDFLSHYSCIERNREHWLTQRGEAAGRWADDRAIPGHAQRRMLLDIFGVDADLFADFSHALNEAAPIDLGQYIRISQVDQDWTAVDTYLFARAKYDFAVFLEKFDPTTEQPKPILTDLIDETVSTELTHPQIAILYHIIGHPINENNGSDIAVKYGQTSGKKLALTYSNLTSELVRTGPGRNTVKNYEKIIPLLKDKYKEQAQRELEVAKRNNRK